MIMIIINNNDNNSSNNNNNTNNNDNINNNDNNDNNNNNNNNNDIYIYIYMTITINPYKDPYFSQPVFHGKYPAVFFFVAETQALFAASFALLAFCSQEHCTLVPCCQWKRRSTLAWCFKHLRR